MSDIQRGERLQLAFILLNIAGLSDRKHADREIADLLFFPTGGGKTEAYLGLAAFVITYRRLTGPGVLGAGVAVIMRYTLRLLTLALPSHSMPRLDLSVSGFASMYPASDWSVLCSGPSWISARVRSH
jgi:hypothetical protein